MRKNKTKFDNNEYINSKILDALERKLGPWVKPWDPALGGNGRPLRHNGVPYTGINVTVLHVDMLLNGWTSPIFLTYKQAQEYGGFAKEKSRARSFFTKVIEKKEEKNGDETVNRFRLLKSYAVFNLDQCENVTLPEKVQAILDDKPSLPEGKRIKKAEAVHKAYLKRAGAPEYIEGQSDQPHYRPMSHAVHMNSIDQYVGREDRYYSTKFHEDAHSTGHSKLLSRQGIVNHAAFASHEYSKEELVAEICSTYICSHLGIMKDDTFEQSAAYISSWSRKLKQNPEWFMQAATQAQKAFDVIVGTDSK